MEKFCENCGAELLEKTIYCPDCGQRLPRDLGFVKGFFVFACCLASVGVIADVTHNLGMMIMSHSLELNSRINDMSEANPYKVLVATSPGYAFALVLLPVGISSIVQSLLSAWFLRQFNIQNNLWPIFGVSCICVIGALVHLFIHEFPIWSYSAMLISGLFVINVTMCAGKWMIGGNNSESSS